MEVTAETPGPASLGQQQERLGAVGDSPFNAAALQQHSLELSKPLSLDPAYGWVLMVLLLALVLFFFLSFNVIRARIRFGVKPPDVYAVKGVTGREGGASEDADSTLLRLSARECDVFNCYQRAHQHAVEMYTVFLPLLLFGGLGFPLTSAFGGLVFLLGTFVYALGYYTGEAPNRKWGAFQVVGLFTCSLTTFMFALQLLWSG